MTQSITPHFDAVEGRYNGVDLEQNILKFWKENQIFEQSLRLSAGRPRFSFNEGPPTANGRPGIHHVLARTFKDIYPRYKTMRGYYAPRIGGWDTHGLPVEHEIEKKLGIFDKNELATQVGIAEFNRLCRESVMTYIIEWEQMTTRMGYWVNLDEAYYTLDNKYIESVWNLLQRIWNKGLIYKGYKVVPYDPRIGATLSSHEVAQGYKEVEDPSLTVRFKLAGYEHTSMLVWTTTPWTLPANMLLAVGDAIEYSWVKADVGQGGETLILASTRVQSYFADTDYTIIKTQSGKDLVGERYERLFDYLNIPSGDPFRVVAADFVSTEDGTGIVHVAPAYGVDDLALGQSEGLPVVHAVGLDGCFKSSVTPVAGLFFKQADAILTELLERAGLMFRNEKKRHNYPFGWRTGDPLIYYAKEAWYIKTTAIKDRLCELNNAIHWVPTTIGQGRFGNWLENNIDWALSRERFWGTPLPVWSDGEGDFICIGSLAELEKLSGKSMNAVDLHRPQIDEITITRDGREYRRVPEVIDCWFDSGAMSYAQWHYPFENQAVFEQHFPADYICEAIDQTRGWFYTLHTIAALADDSVAFKNCVCLNHIVDENGKKMSKSQGNIINPYDVFDTVGVDALRWLFLARTAPDAQKRISVEIVREVAATFVNTLWNTYSFFILYARLDHVDLSRSVDVNQRAEIDRWVLALAHGTVKIVTDALDQYDAYTAGQALEKLVDQLSNWYVRRNRRRFWKSGHGENKNGDDKQSAYLTLYECLDLIQKMIAPFMPFLAEEIYRNLRNAAPSTSAISIHLERWPDYDGSLLDDDLVAEMDTIQTIVGLGRSARELSRVRIRQPLCRILISADKPARAAVKHHLPQVLEELNIQSVEFIESSDALIRYHLKPEFSRLGKRFGKLMPQIKAALARIDQAEAAKIVRHLENNECFELPVGSQILSLEKADVQVVTSSRAGFTQASGAGFLVALDTSITQDLEVEGIARELVRTVQDGRKSAELEISDRIHLGIDGSELVQLALVKHFDYIKSETLAVELTACIEGGFTVDRSIENQHWKITIKKAKSRAAAKHKAPTETAAKSAES